MASAFVCFIEEVYYSFVWVVLGEFSAVNADGVLFVTLHSTPDVHVEYPRDLLQLIEAQLSAD